MTRDEAEDLCLSGFKDCPRLEGNQLILEHLRFKPGTEVVFFASPVPVQKKDQVTDELFLDFLLQSQAERQYAKIASSDEIYALDNQLNLMPSPIQLHILLTREDNDLDLEISKDFPTDFFISNHLVVPIKLLLHPSGADEILIKLLSGTLHPDAQLKIVYQGKVCLLELTVSLYRKSILVPTEQLEEYFEFTA